MRDHAVVDARGASGGILTAWDTSVFRATSVDPRRFTLTVHLASTTDALAVAVSNVYAPCAPELRPEFFDELQSVGSSISGPWLLVGDFNIAVRPEDRSGGDFDAALAAAFCDVLSHLALQELPLPDRRYTWSNMQELPTLVRLDRAFINLAWATNLFNTTPRADVRVTSDHSPLVISAPARAPASTIFRYEKCWALKPSHREFVAVVWARPCNHLRDPAKRIARKLKWVRADSKRWARLQCHPDRIAARCREVINFLDCVEERRWLSVAESLFRRLVRSQLSAHLTA